MKQRTGRFKWDVLVVNVALWETRAVWLI